MKGYNAAGKPQFEDYKIGDKVWDSEIGEWVKIKLYVPSEKGRECFELETDVRIFHTGQTNYKCAPRYFCQPFEIPAEAYERPKPDLKVDDKVLVWDKKFPEEKYPMHFAGWTEHGRMKTFEDGRSLFTDNGHFDLWDNYEVVEDAN